MRTCGLLGENIYYSKSPAIHKDYYSHKNISLEYKIFDIKQEELSSFIKNLKNKEIIGFNVTIPYKETILKYLDTVTYPADKILAVNTVLVKDDKLIGYNTDYFGFIKSLEAFKLSLNGCSALILGAGGAAKAVYHALAYLNCKEITVANGNVQKAKLYFEGLCSVIPLNNSTNINKYDIIINCTPLGGLNYIDLMPVELDTLKQGCIVYDLVYNPSKTKLLKEAEKIGAVIINGENMLKYQAYAAADIWIDYLNYR